MALCGREWNGRESLLLGFGLVFLLAARCSRDVFVLSVFVVVAVVFLFVLLFVKDFGVDGVVGGRGPRRAVGSMVCVRLTGSVALPVARTVSIGGIEVGGSVIRPWVFLTS